MILITETREAAAIARLAADLSDHGGVPRAIHTMSIDMSPAYIKGIQEYLPNAMVTFDKCHVVAHASHALDLTRRAEQKQEPKLKGLRWKLLKALGRLSQTSQADIKALMKHLSAYRTACRSRQARAWRYREDLREILRRKQSNVVRRMLTQWRTNVMPSKV